MHRIFVTIALLLSVLPSAPLFAKEPDWVALDALVDRYDQSDAPGVSLAISVGGETVYQRAAGLADLAHNIPIDEDTRFPVASVSKQFTAFAIMMLADEGKLSLDQDIRDFFPEMEERAVPVTVRDLLNHAGGLREANSLMQLTGRWESSPFTQDRSTDLILRDSGQNFAAGARQEYSNSGYQLLAQIIAKVADQPFADFLEERIFNPLGMERTLVRTRTDQLIEDMAVGYKPVGDGFVYENLLAATYGSTGIVSDPRDLLRWGQALNREEIGNAAIIAAMAQRDTLDDGRVSVSGNGQEYRHYRGLDTWSHGGATGGYRSFLLRIPETNTVIAVIGNRTDFLKATFAFDVADLLLGETMEPAPSEDFKPETAAQLDRYVGDYRLFPGYVFSIRRDGNQLTFATFGKDDAFAPEPIAPGEFLLNPATDVRIEFKDFENGRASHLRWQISEDGYLLAPKVDMRPLPSEPLDIDLVAGTYFNEPLQQVVRLFERDGALWARTGDGDETPFSLYQPDTLRAEGSGSVLRIKLVRDTAGRVNSLLASNALADDLEYRRFEIE